MATHPPLARPARSDPRPDVGPRDYRRETAPGEPGKPRSAPTSPGPVPEAPPGVPGPRIVTGGDRRGPARRLPGENATAEPHFPDLKAVGRAVARDRRPDTGSGRVESGRRSASRPSSADRTAETELAVTTERRGGPGPLRARG